MSQDVPPGPVGRVVRAAQVSRADPGDSRSRHIQLDHRTDDSGTGLTWTLLLPQDTVDVVGADRIRALRRRLDRLVNGHLREAFDL